MSTPADPMAELYADRNRLVLLAACLADEAGYEVVVIADPAAPDWPVPALTLGAQGQVSWHVPRALLNEAALADFWRPGTWDGHSNEDKAQRIMAWCGPADSARAHE